MKGSENMLDPKQIEDEGRKLSRERLAQTFVIATNPDEIIKATEPYLRMGFTHVQYLSSSPNENHFIEIMSNRVLPYLRDNWS